MNWDVFGLVVLIATIIGVIVFFYLFGRSYGVEAERARIERLCHQAILKRASGSVRWVWNAVGSGAKDLAPEEEFFSFCVPMKTVEVRFQGVERDKLYFQSAMTHKVRLRVVNEENVVRALREAGFESILNVEWNELPENNEGYK